VLDIVKAAAAADREVNRSRWHAIVCHVAELRDAAKETDAPAVRREYNERLIQFVQGLLAGILDTGEGKPFDDDRDTALYRSLAVLRDGYGYDAKHAADAVAGQYLQAQVAAWGLPDGAGPLLDRVGAMVATGKNTMTGPEIDRLKAMVVGAPARPLLPTVLLARSIVILRTRQGRRFPEIRQEVEALVNPLLAEIARTGTLEELSLDPQGDTAARVWAVSALVDLFTLINQESRITGKDLKNIGNSIFDVMGISSISAAA
jgi:hypothetical protein